MELNWFRNRRESDMSNSTVDSGYAGSASSSNNDGSSSLQMHGIMLKKPFGHQSTKWSRRFFVLKEGFLLYYAESEKKAFENKKYFNIHPKGVVPLGYCTIEDTTAPGMQFCININHHDFKAPICVATDDEESRKEWIRSMDRATKVTLQNSELGETMIKSLQEQSLQLARERQEYVDKFITEAEELGAERELREALEEFNQELEEENARIEGLVEELKSDHVQVKNELLKAIETSKKLETEREEMALKTKDLQQNLELLSNERSAIIQQLQDHESRSEIPAEQNAELARQLAAIEQKALSLERDKDAIRQSLEDNERKSQKILREREMISQEAEELKCEMEELSLEKQIAKKELEDEIVARMQLQKELEDCKSALRRLETKALGMSAEKSSVASSGIQGSSAPNEKGNRSDDEQILKDVKSLREFFENCARENKRETDKPVPTIRRNRPATNGGDGSEKEFANPTTSPARTVVRGSIMHRRRNTTSRCRSMVISDNTAASVLLREPSYRKNVLGMMARQKRAASLSHGKGKRRSDEPVKVEN